MIGVGEKLQGRKYGFVLKDGSYFVEPQFDGVSKFWTIGSCGYNIVYKEVNGKKLYGLLDSTGKLIIDTKYSFISVSKYDAERGYIDVRSDSLYGFYDIRRGKLIEPQYTSVMITTDYGVKTTKKINGKDKVGFYHNNGKVIEPKYDWFWYWDSDNALYKTELNGKFGLLDRNGEELLEPKYDEMRNFGNVIFAVLNGQTILIDGNGKPVNDKQFEQVGRLDGFDLLIVEVNGKKGVFDPASNKYLIEPKYDEVQNFFREGFARVVLNGKYGIIDRDGKVLLEPVYEYIYPNAYLNQIRVEKTNPDGSKFYAYEDDKTSTPVVKVKKDGKEFFLNKDFTPMQDAGNSAAADFDTIGVFEEGEVARVTKGDKVGYVRKDFTYVVKPVWDTVYRLKDTDKYFHIQKGGKWGAVLMDGSVIEPVYESMLTFGEDGIAVVTINGKQKYLKSNGQPLNNETYEYAYPFSEGKGLVFPKFNECYFIDTNGKKVSDSYMTASSYGEGLAFVFTSMGGRYIDHSGKVVLGDKTIITHGFPFKNGIAVASVYVDEKKAVLYGLLKKDGSWLVVPTFDRYSTVGDTNIFHLNGREATVSPDGKINWK
jgi:hypothetical protein